MTDWAFLPLWCQWTGICIRDWTFRRILDWISEGALNTFDGGVPLIQSMPKSSVRILRVRVENSQEHTSAFRLVERSKIPMKAKENLCNLHRLCFRAIAGPHPRIRLQIKSTSIHPAIVSCLWKANTSCWERVGWCRDTSRKPNRIAGNPCWIYLTQCGLSRAKTKTTKLQANTAASTMILRSNGDGECSTISKKTRTTRKR
mmetsp:Transcript_7331/g.17925  ORF Transcript_7331/g.17925 Transcript_7331/m.17925 type:complete len:202 (-) Transcript_7331:637-1242(-)